MRYAFTSRLLLIAFLFLATTTNGIAQATRVHVDLNLPIGGEGAETTRIYGPTVGAELGADYSHGIVAGDWNADGNQDLFVGAPKAIAGVNRPSAGQGIVLFGPISSTSSPLDLSNQPTLLSTVFLANRAGDRLGYGAASGDFNGDGNDDLAIGAFLGTPPRDGAGIIYVFPGGCEFPTGLVDLSQSQLALGVTTLVGRSVNYQLGSAIAVGDFNGDGYSDLLAGAKTAPKGTLTSVGEALIFQGGPNFFGNHVDTLVANPDIPMARIIGKAMDDFTGVSVASGDVNGDGYEDAIIGAAAFSANVSFPGQVYILYGAPSFGGGVFDMSLATGTFGETRIIGGVGAVGLGISVASGDIDNDGVSDVVCGSHVARGAVHVIYGRPEKPGNPALLGSQLNLAAPGSARVAKITGRGTQDRLGFSVATTDSDANGYLDVIGGGIQSIGVGLVNSGSVSLVDGSSIPSGQTLALQSTQENLWVTGDNTQDKLGSGSEGGFDLDGDGAADFACAAIDFDGAAGTSTGAAYVVYGTTPVQETTARQWYPAGMAYQRGMGGRLSPVVRAWVGFLSGGISECSVTITRNNTAISGLGATSEVLPVYWTVETSRNELMLTFKYTDVELGGFDESLVSLFQAPEPDGPWTRVEPQVLNAEANLVHCVAPSQGVFALAVTSLAPAECGPMNALIGLGIPRLTTQD